MMRENDEAKEVLQKLMEKLGDASEVLIDLGEYLEISERRARRVIKRIIRAAVILVVGYLVVLALTGDAIKQAHEEADDAQTATQEAKASIVKNQLAIRVGCRLLSDAIEDAAGPHDPPTAQDRLTAKLVSEILEGMTPEEQKEIKDLQAQVKAQGGPIPIPDCESVAENPDQYLKSLSPPRKGG